jgi:hypothetical protein
MKLAYSSIYPMSETPDVVLPGYICLCPAQGAQEHCTEWTIVISPWQLRITFGGYLKSERSEDFGRTSRRRVSQVRSVI